MNGGTANVSVDASTLLDNLDFALMINGEARKGRWLVATDVIYLDLSNADSAVRSVDFNPGTGPINVSTGAANGSAQSSLRGDLWTLVGGYAAVEGKASLDVIGGFRYLGITAKTDWQLNAAVTLPNGATAIFARSGNVEKSDDIWVGDRRRQRPGQAGQ